MQVINTVVLIIFYCTYFTIQPRMKIYFAGTPIHQLPSCHSSPSPSHHSSSMTPELALELSLSNQTSNLTTSERHRQIRLQADKHYRNNAEKMKLQYSKRKRHLIKTYVPGDSVTVRIPRNERSSSDMPRLLCRVLKVEKKNMYRLQ